MYCVCDKCKEKNLVLRYYQDSSRQYLQCYRCRYIEPLSPVSPLSYYAGLKIGSQFTIAKGTRTHLPLEAVYLLVTDDLIVSNSGKRFPSTALSAKTLVNSIREENEMLSAVARAIASSFSGMRHLWEKVSQCHETEMRGVEHLYQWRKDMLEKGEHLRPYQMDDLIMEAALKSVIGSTKTYTIIGFLSVLGYPSQTAIVNFLKNHATVAMVEELMSLWVYLDLSQIYPSQVLDFLVQYIRTNIFHFSNHLISKRVYLLGFDTMVNYWKRREDSFVEFISSIHSGQPALTEDNRFMCSLPPESQKMLFDMIVEVLPYHLDKTWAITSQVKRFLPDDIQLWQSLMQVIIESNPINKKEVLYLLKWATERNFPKTAYQPMLPYRDMLIALVPTNMEGIHKLLESL